MGTNLSRASLSGTFLNVADLAEANINLANLSGDERHIVASIVDPQLKRGASYRDILNALDECDVDHVSYDRLFLKWRAEFGICSWLEIADCPNLDPERQKILRRRFQGWLAKRKKKLLAESPAGGPAPPSSPS